MVCPMEDGLCGNSCRKSIWENYTGRLADAVQVGASGKREAIIKQALPSSVLKLTSLFFPARETMCYVLADLSANSWRKIQ